MAQIVITGASRGIGRAMTEGYIARGDSVLAVVRDLAALDAAGSRVEGADYVEADVTDDAALERVAAAVGARPVDLLIANAGLLIGRGGVEDPAYTRQVWNDMAMTNIFGPFATARALLPALRRAQAGRIAILGSIMGSSELSIQKGNAYAYRATKAAAINLARNLAGELRGQGIAVGAYHPGWVRTDMGGSSADVAIEDSAAGLMRRFDALTLETTGVFEDYRGEPLPF